MARNSKEEGRFFSRAPAFLQHTSPGRVKGSFSISGPLLPGQASEGETLMCMHCQNHWRIRPGSGMERGWCSNCNGPTCGWQQCETTCVHFEKAIEIMEGRNPDTSQFKGAYIL